MRMRRGRARAGSRLSLTTSRPSWTLLASSRQTRCVHVCRCTKHTFCATHANSTSCGTARTCMRLLQLVVANCLCHNLPVCGEGRHGQGLREKTAVGACAPSSALHIYAAAYNIGPCPTHAPRADIVKHTSACVSNELSCYALQSTPRGCTTLLTPCASVCVCHMDPYCVLYCTGSGPWVRLWRHSCACGRAAGLQGCGRQHLTLPGESPDALLRTISPDNRMDCPACCSTWFAFCFAIDYTDY